MPGELTIRNMIRAEVDRLVEWAAEEGWNPGLHDADLFWATDPDAFIAAELDGELIGGGAITSYEGQYGFMGFFIVRPEYRGRGLGNRLWHARRDRLLTRLRPGAAIGLDGVFEMQDYYAEGGFVFSHRNLRYRADVPGQWASAVPLDENIVPLAELPFSKLAEYDRHCFGVPREDFLARWTGQRDACSLGYLHGDELQGFGVVRRCGEGCKLGPLFAHSFDAANALYGQLSAFGAGGPIFLDAPENNPLAMALVQQHRMSEVFGCARMYIGSPPDVAHERIYGVTTFELG